MSSQLRNRLSSTSPISKLQALNKIPLKDIHNSVDIKLTLMREYEKNNQPSKSKLKRGKPFSSNRESQVFADQYSQMKASSVIYKIPELSPPQISYDISDQLRHKINEIKSEMVTKLPTIKSSQFSQNRLESLFSHRTAVKDLQLWLQQKLKHPPLTHEDSIQYKNMIMGVGMKKAIRLIGTRCAEEANIVHEIWQLTWSICRQIILYLSKRAHKCEKILQQQASFFRSGCQKKIKSTQAQITSIKSQNQELKQRLEKFSLQVKSLKKKNKQLKLVKLNLEGCCSQLKSQFEIVFKQNLLLHLKIAPNDQACREWVKRKYRVFLDSKKKNKQTFKEFLDKFMEENRIQVDHDELDEMEMAIQINRFKNIQNQRNLQIQKQLQQRFITFQKQTQTITIQKQSRTVQTDKILVQDEQIETEAAQKLSIGCMTDVEKQCTKLKGKKQKPGKKTSQNITQRKKDKQKKLKIKQKISINQEIVGKENTENSEQQQTKIIESIRQQKQQETIQVNIYNQISKNLATLDQNISNPILQNIVEQDSQNKGFSKHDNHNQNELIKIQSRQLHNDRENQSNFQPNLQNPILNDKSGHFEIEIQENQAPMQVQNQKNIQNQRIRIMQLEQRHQRQLKALKDEIDNKNSTIANLNKKMNKILEERERFEEKNKNKESGAHQDQEQSQFYDLIKNKRYDQLIEILRSKNLISEPVNNKQSVQAQLSPIKESAHRQDLTKFNSERSPLAYQYLKKNIGGSFKKYSQYSAKNFLEDDVVQQNERQAAVGQSQLVEKPSRRTSISKISNISALKQIKNELQCNYQQKQLFFEPVMLFVESCLYYYNQFMPFESQNGNLQKQLGLSEYNKKLLKEQYRQIYKQVMDGHYAQKNEKQMRTVIDKALNYLLKQLCKQIQLAQKQGLQRIQEIKISYSSLPILMANRFNMNFGVRKVASKHIKDFLICLKGIKKYTQKYSIIQYFMLNSVFASGNSNPIFEQLDTQLLFFFILLITVMEGMSSDHVVTKTQAETISELAKKYLTRDQNFISYVVNLPTSIAIQNCNNFVNFYKRFIKKYEEVSLGRIQQMEFIYNILRKKFKDGKQGIEWTDFLQFVSIFNNVGSAKNEQSSSSSWYSIIINSLIQIMLQQRSNQADIISHQCFLKFIIKCPQFNLVVMKAVIYPLTLETLVDLSNVEMRNNIAKLCEYNVFLSHIVKNLFSTQQISESQIEFWVRFLRAFKLEAEVDNILGTLISGVFDPRTKSVIFSKQQ